MRILGSLPSLIEKTFPMPGRFRSALPSQIAELSRLLTGGRGDRSLSYLSRPNFLSAYLRYFLPWNLYRLCRLLPSLDISLSAGDTIVDIGCGPLTLTAALWISRPDLRSVPLEFRCIDRCAPALEAGKKFFAAICAAEAGGANGEKQPWKIHTMREDIDLRAGKKDAKHKTGGAAKASGAALVCAINIFNEVYEGLPHSDTKGLERAAANAAGMMQRYALPSSSFLTVEPGVPHSGHFITLLRRAFLNSGMTLLSPCTHAEDCPMPGSHGKAGKKSRWCHFSYDIGAEDSGAENSGAEGSGDKSNGGFQELLRLSAAAGLPKERLALSYLLTGAKKPPASSRPAVSTAADNTRGDIRRVSRVISDAFPLPDSRYGRYCCSSQGLILLTGEKRQIEKTVSGSLVNAVVTDKQRDAKSGALIANLQTSANQELSE